MSGLGNLKLGAPPSVQTLGGGKTPAERVKALHAFQHLGGGDTPSQDQGYPHSIGCLTPIGMLQDLVKEVLEGLQSPWGPQSNPSEEEQNLQEQSIVGHQ